MQPSIRFLTAVLLLCSAIEPLCAQKDKTSEPPPKGPPPALIAEASLRIYPVPSGNAEGFAKLFQEVFKDGPKVRIVALNANQLAVWAGPEEHRLIAKQQALSAALTEVIPLTNLDGAKVAQTLKTMLADPKARGPFIEWEAQQNALIIRGSEEQVRVIMDVLRRLGEGVEKPATIRILTVEKGSAATLAEAIQDVMSKMRKNPVNVIVPAKAGSDGPNVDPSKKSGPDKKDAGAGKIGLPVNLTAFGHRLIITTEDREAMALAVELAQLLQAPAGEGDFEVIRLKHAGAASVAQILEEAFNGASSRAFRGGGGPIGGGFGQQRPERIRVIADPATNTLLLKASPLDVLTIRSLLTRALDVPADAARIETETKKGKKKGGD